MNKNIIIAGVVVVALIGGGFLLLQRGNTPQTQTPAQSESMVPSPTVASESGSMKEEAATDAAMKKQFVEVMVESNGLKFTPNEIKVKKGDAVKLTYKNNLGTHDFALDEFTVKTKRLSAGSQETITFIADKAGTFEFYCSVEGHRQSGMKGAFIVE